MIDATARAAVRVVAVFAIAFVPAIVFSERIWMRHFRALIDLSTPEITRRTSAEVGFDVTGSVLDQFLSFFVTSGGPQLLGFVLLVGTVAFFSGWCLRWLQG